MIFYAALQMAAPGRPSLRPNPCSLFPALDYPFKFVYTITKVGKGDVMNTDRIIKFKMPRYNELPNIGLYIDQVLAYLDEIFEPLELSKGEKLLTSSMVNNYVKKGVLPVTVKKRYYREHLAYLVIVCMAKQIFTIDEVVRMIKIQKSHYNIETAYNYICDELEKIVVSVFTEQPLPQDTSRTHKQQRYFVRNTLISVVYKIHTQRLMDIYDPLPDEENK